MKAVGIDGCKAGWVTACYEDEQVLFFKTIDEVVEHYGNGYKLLIDIPIGLASAGTTRNCESKAREKLQGARKSSVFPVPCRESLGLYEAGHTNASEKNKDVLGIGMSIQSYSIMPKIKEVDDFLIKMKKNQTSNMSQHIRESHPEIAFHFLNDRKPLKYKKKSKEGINERLTILNMYDEKYKHDERSERLYKAGLTLDKRKNIAKDDIIDALCLALTQHLVLTYPDKYILSSFASNPLLDEKGIEMAIYYAEKAQPD